MSTLDPRPVVSVDVGDLILLTRQLGEAYALLLACDGLPQQALTARRVLQMAKERLESIDQGRPARFE